MEKEEGGRRGQVEQRAGEADVTSGGSLEVVDPRIDVANPRFGAQPMNPSPIHLRRPGGGWRSASRSDWGPGSSGSGVTFRKVVPLLKEQLAYTNAHQHKITGGQGISPFDNILRNNFGNYEFGVCFLEMV